MSGVNKAIILGRLGADPEVKTISGGSTVCRFNVATSESWNDKSGQRQERTEWHRVVVWGKLAEVCGKYLSKGKQVYLEGRIETRSWENSEGQKQYTTEVVANKIEFIGGGTYVDKSVGQASPNDFDFGPEPSFDTEESPVWGCVL